ncbi:Endo-1 4-beta-xylanase 4 [Euphorbia peplus]|nr:Endo-1 4-beta-xylanase 4 [Euphorbia peplus]
MLNIPFSPSTTTSKAYVWLLLSIFIFSGHGIHAVSYDYSATTECLKDPQRAQYGGGMLRNAEFNNSLKGWGVFGKAEIKEGISKDGNRFVIAHNRTHSLDSISQNVLFQQGYLYTFSAWIQTNKGSENVAIIFRYENGEMYRAGQVIARDGCWSFLKGGFFANFSTPVDILFESNNTKVEIWVDNVSLQPFTMEEWTSHHQQIIHKERKSKVKFQVTDANKNAIKDAELSIEQTKTNFPFGCAMNHYILENKDYQNWFSSRFKYTTFTNEMKWYTTEKKRGIENYTVADGMLNFAQQNNIAIRGHNIFWDDPQHQPEWVGDLSPDELREAASKRIDSVVSRYSGKLIAWDVMNENLHFRFYEDKLGENASSMYFSRAYELDPTTRMFMNEYNTIEYCQDKSSNPARYVNRLKEILAYPGNEKLLAGIGVQGHFSAEQPNLAYMRAALDTLASTGLPIWLTEVSVDNSPNQAEYLEQILREGYSHPGVEGIIMFVGPAVAGFNKTTLADRDFKNTPPGDVVDKLLNEWKSQATRIKSDGQGFFEVSLHHGDYNISVKHPVTSSWTSFSYNLTKDGALTETVNLRINV